MKKIVFLVFSLAFFAACGDKKAVVSQSNADSINTDSIICDDTISADTIDAVPPKSADELFDDFIFGFMSNRRFQRDRVKNPLPIDMYGRVKNISPKDWKYDRLYFGRDAYTVLFDSEKALRIEKDTSLRKVTVEWIYLEKYSKKAYNFERINGQWMLVKVSTSSLSQDVNGDFYKFYNKFSTDSVFQSETIAEPLHFVTYDPDDFNDPIDGQVDIEQWYAFHPVLPTNVITNINYGQRYSNRNKRVLVIRGVSNSMYSVLTFQKQETGWQLIKLEN